MVAASCLIFYLLAIGLPMLSTINDVLLAVLALLACVEKLCSIMNLVSVERDWVRIRRYTMSTNMTLIGSVRLWLSQEMIMKASGVSIRLEKQETNTKY